MIVFCLHVGVIFKHKTTLGAYYSKVALCIFTSLGIKTTKKVLLNEIYQKKFYVTLWLRWLIDKWNHQVQVCHLHFRMKFECQLISKLADQEFGQWSKLKSLNLLLSYESKFCPNSLFYQIFYNHLLKICSYALIVYFSHYVPAFSGM